MTQKEQIKNILLQKGYIDNFKTINTRLSIRLGMHINLLRNEGMEIIGCYGNRIQNFNDKQKKDNAKNFFYFTKKNILKEENGNYKLKKI
jgi:ribosomal protein S8